MPTRARPKETSLEIPLESVRAFRLERQQLVERAPRQRLVQVTSAIIGAQAQMASAGFLSLGVRISDLTETDVLHALHRSKTLVRMWGPRGTVHIHAARDLDWLRPAWAPTDSHWQRWEAYMGVSRERYQELKGEILALLERGPLPRAAIRAALGGSSVPRNEPGDPSKAWGQLFDSWGGVFFVLTREGHVVFGPSRGNETHFVRVDRWWRGRRYESVEGLPEAARQQADVEMLRRYLRCYGPGSEADFRYWAGFKGPRVPAAFHALRDELVGVRVGRSSQWLLRRDLRALSAAKERAAVRLLPHFDTLLTGHRDKSWLLPPRYRTRVVRAAGWVYPTALVDGAIVGTWLPRQDRSGFWVEFHPFQKTSAETRARLADEAREVARFVGVDPAKRPLRLGRHGPPASAKTARG